MFSDEDVEEFVIAIRAAEVMANRWQQDVAILPDFRVVPLKTNDEPPLEIVSTPDLTAPAFHNKF